MSTLNFTNLSEPIRELGRRTSAGHITIERRNADKALLNGMEVCSIGIIAGLARRAYPIRFLAARISQFEYRRAGVAMPQSRHRETPVRSQRARRHIDIQ